MRLLLMFAEKLRRNQTREHLKKRQFRKLFSARKCVWRRKLWPAKHQLNCQSLQAQGIRSSISYLSVTLSIWKSCSGHLLPLTVLFPWLCAKSCFIDRGQNRGRINVTESWSWDNVVGDMFVLDSICINQIFEQYSNNWCFFCVRTYVRMFAHEFLAYYVHSYCR